MIANPPLHAVNDVVLNNEPPLIKPLKNCPRQQTSDLVHSELSRFFGELFPSVIIHEDDIHYQLELADIHDSAIEPPISLQSFHEVPEDEVYHLLQGWIRLQQALASDGVHPDAKSALANFRVPDPRQGIDSYRIYKDEGRTKMFIEWGLEKTDCPAVKLDQALAIILGVPVSKLQTILFTFMMTVMPTETIHNSLIEAVNNDALDEDDVFEHHGLFHDPIIKYSTIAAAIIILFAVLLTFQWNSTQPHPKESPIYSLNELTHNQKATPIPTKTTQADPFATVEPQ